MIQENNLAKDVDLNAKIDLSPENSVLAEKIRKKLEKSVKLKRYQHSQRVATTSWFMAKLYNADSDKAYIAGLAHDICKELSDEKLIKLASKDGRQISDFELSKPSLLHGRAAAVKLQEDFDVHDEDILQAVAFHTLGGKNMCPLAKIVFCADKIEPGRPQSSVEYRTNLFSKNLNDLCLSVLIENFEYLKAKGKTISPENQAFYESLCS